MKIVFIFFASLVYCTQGYAYFSNKLVVNGWKIKKDSIIFSVSNDNSEIQITDKDGIFSLAISQVISTQAVANELAAGQKKWSEIGPLEVNKWDLVKPIWNAGLELIAKQDLKTLPDLVWLTKKTRPKYSQLAEPAWIDWLEKNLQGREIETRSNKNKSYSKVKLLENDARNLIGSFFFSAYLRLPPTMVSKENAFVSLKLTTSK